MLEGLSFCDVANEDLNEQTCLLLNALLQCPQYESSCSRGLINGGKNVEKSSKAIILVSSSIFRKIHRACTKCLQFLLDLTYRSRYCFCSVWLLSLIVSLIR